MCAKCRFNDVTKRVIFEQQYWEIVKRELLPKEQKTNNNG